MNVNLFNAINKVAVPPHKPNGILANNMYSAGHDVK
jgi:hypothetical protein